MSKDANNPVTFRTVFSAEQQSIDNNQNNGYRLGLALSGGGIRSATFNLGVLKGLARRGILRQVDYLSTVSGGGYIGSWLAAWARRAPGGIAQVQQQIQDVPEPKAIAHLRHYSNYLTPRVGFLSADFWTGLATHFRNTALNLCVLVPMLMALLCLPYIFTWIGVQTRATFWAPWTLAAGGALLIATMVYAGARARTPSADDSHKNAESEVRERISSDALGALLGVLFLFSCWLSAQALTSAWLADIRPQHPGMWALCGGIIAFATTMALAFYLLNRRRLSQKSYDGCYVWSLALASFGGGATSGCLLALIAGGLGANSAIWSLLLATPLVVIAVGSGIGIYIGIMGGLLSEAAREWWARFAAWVAIATTAWCLLHSFAYVVPQLYKSVDKNNLYLSVSSVAWTLLSVIGVGIGRSRFTGSPTSNAVLEIFARATPYIFVLGLFAVAGIANSVVLSKVTDCQFSGLLLESAAICAGGTAPALSFSLAVGGLFVLVVVFLATRIDINLFSFHSFYSNRLMRCYLGASRDPAARRPNGFSQFDLHDDLDLAPPKDDTHPLKPLHIVNAALNVSKSENLAWQERKALSFALTPLYCGYATDPTLAHGEDDGARSYCPTAAFMKEPRYRGGKLGLATAMAISGAAASPNMGHHTSPALAFLLTVFNVRLGRWMRNPRVPINTARNVSNWRRSIQASEIFRIRYLLMELFGATTESDDYVYLSDGGHFDNLGIYELVRRGCRYIIASDAGADPNYQFEDLGNAIRKCRIDFGVSIDLDPSVIRPRDETGLSTATCVIGKIDYGSYNPSGTAQRLAPGWLLYLKASVLGAEDPDVMQYRNRCPDFPHEPTSDQWFSESQFESYKTLGETIAVRAFESVDKLEVIDDSVFHQLHSIWAPASASTHKNFTRHVHSLQQLTEELKASSQLAFLDEQIIPEWPYLLSGEAAVESDPARMWLPEGDHLRRLGFYYCSRFIQLMEAVYLDLDLDSEWRHPDNRGWMNLFKHWSWSGMFRATWAVSAAMHGARFQRFCRQRLDLSYRDPQVRGPLRVANSRDLKKLLENVHAELEDDGSNRVKTNFVENACIEARIKKLHGRDDVAPAEFLVAQIVLSIDVPEIPGKSLDFPIACALAFRAADAGTQIVYFRVRDHLRRMGLGARGLKAIIDKYPDWTVADLDLIRAIESASTAAETPPRDGVDPISMFHALFDSLHRQRRLGAQQTDTWPDPTLPPVRQVSRR